MNAMAQMKEKKSSPLAFMKGIHRWPVIKGPATRKRSPFDDAIMKYMKVTMIHAFKFLVLKHNTNDNTHYTTSYKAVHGCDTDIVLDHAFHNQHNWLKYISYQTKLSLNLIIC